MKDFLARLVIWEKGKAWWSTLALREKQIVGAGTVLLVIFIIYAGAWSPLHERALTMRHHLQTDEQTLQWMKAADIEIRALEGQSKQNAATLTPIALLSILQNKINQAGLSAYLTELKQTNQETIVVQFQKVEFDAFIKLLISVMKEHAISIAQLSVVSDNAPGVVNVEMSIQVA